MPNWKKVLVSGSAIEVRHVTASGNISSNGDIEGSSLATDQYIYHNNDPNTYLNFTDDRLRFNIGGISYIDLNDSTAAPHDITFNDGGNNVDLTIKGSSNNPLFKTDASLNRIGTHGKGSPEVAFHIGGSELRVDGDISASGAINTLSHITASGNISSNGDIEGVTGSFDYVKTDKLQVGTTGGTDVLSIDGGDLQLENGKQITFSDIGDGNTGRVRIVGNEDNDIIQMHVDNSTSHVLALTTTGVGVGTTSPGEKLEVVGNISSSGEITSLLFNSDQGIVIAGQRILYDSTGDNLKTEDSGLWVEGGHITASFNISASATSTISAGVGAFTELHGAGTETSLEVDGPITGSAFQGTKHILVNNGFYVNDNPFIQNSLYFGGTLQHNPFNWNDPQAIGGDPMTVSSFNISDDDQNWGRILPFDVSKIEILCGLRPGSGAGNQFSLVLYTASRISGAVTSITLTRVAENGVTFDGSGKYTNNDLTYTGNLTAGTMIYIGVGTNTSSPSAKNARGYMSVTITAK